MGIAENDILKFAVENGIIDADAIRKQIEMKEREQLLAKHTYEIWKGKNNKWYTYLPDKEKGIIRSTIANIILGVVLVPAFQLLSLFSA